MVLLFNFAPAKLSACVVEGSAYCTPALYPSSSLARHPLRAAVPSNIWTVCEIRWRNWNGVRMEANARKWSWKQRWTSAPARKVGWSVLSADDKRAQQVLDEVRR